MRSWTDMFKFTFSDPPEGVSNDEIILHNLQVADKYHDLILMNSCMMAWLNHNKGSTYRDAKVMLRQNKCSTHLIAHLHYDKKYSCLLNGESKTHGCIFSCRPAPHALQEVLNHWTTYEDNLSALADTGILIADDIDKVPDNVKLSQNEQSLSTKIANSSVYLNVVEQSTDEVITDIQKEIFTKYQKHPQTTLYGLGQHGNPICVFCIDGKIVCFLWEANYLARHFHAIWMTSNSESLDQK